MNEELEFLRYMADRLLEAFQPDCCVSEDAVRDAVARSGMFNIIHTGWAIKADLIVRRQSEYRDARDSASASQYQDVVQLLSAVPDLDSDYLEHWAGALGTANS